MRTHTDMHITSKHHNRLSSINRIAPTTAPAHQFVFETHSSIRPTYTFVSKLPNIKKAQ